jgi:hypothetical protein
MSAVFFGSATSAPVEATPSIIIKVNGQVVALQTGMTGGYNNSFYGLPAQCQLQSLVLLESGDEITFYSDVILGTSAISVGEGSSVENYAYGFKVADN